MNDQRACDERNRNTGRQGRVTQDCIESGDVLTQDWMKSGDVLTQD